MGLKKYLLNRKDNDNDRWLLLKKIIGLYNSIVLTDDLTNRRAMSISGGDLVTPPTEISTAWPDCPIDVYYLDNGAYTTDFDVDDYFYEGAGKTYHVAITGDDSNDGLTIETALRSIHVAVAKSDVDIITVHEGTYDKEHGFNGVGITRSMSIIGKTGDKVTITTHKDGVVWSKSAGYSYVYEANFPNFDTMVDTSILLYQDQDYSNHKQVASIAEVDAEAGTWYFDDLTDTVYCRTYDDRPADSSLRCYLKVYNCIATGDTTLFLKNLNFEAGSNGCVKMGVGVNSKLYCKDISVKYSFGAGIGVTDGVGYLQNCLTSSGLGDGFGNANCNYIEYNCVARNNGYWILGNQGSSSHDGSVAIRLNGAYWDNYRQNINDVTEGTNVWNVGCIAIGADTEDIRASDATTILQGCIIPPDCVLRNIAEEINNVIDVTEVGTDPYRYTFVVPDIEAPEPPTNLISTDKTDVTVTLTWDASVSVDVVGYEIFRDDVSVGLSSELTFEDTALVPETTYSYTVKAYDGAGNRSIATSPLEVTTEQSTFTPILDGVVNVEMAHSVSRQLLSTSTKAIRVIRLSDNAEQDIGYAGEGINEVDLLSFVGSSDGEITIVYNQVDDGLTANYVPTGSRPRIVTSGVIEKENLKPIADCYADLVTRPMSVTKTTNQPIYIANVAKASSVTEHNWLKCATPAFFIGLESSDSSFRAYAGKVLSTNAIWDTDYHTWAISVNGATSSLSIDGATSGDYFVSGDLDTNEMVDPSWGYNWRGKLSEIIVLSDNIDLSNIITNQKLYYGIT